MQTSKVDHSAWPPVWASAWGTDACGTFARLCIGAVEIGFRWISAGQFTMGSPEDESGRYPDEKAHAVTISRGFWMGTHPVIQAEYEVVTGANPSHFKGKRRPVESVDWNDAADFGVRLTTRVREVVALPQGFVFRLPTEAEWEYACRAGTNSAFNDGSTCTLPDGKDPALDRLGWFDKNSGQETHPVGEKLPNAWGLHDMHGNVWEWCADAADWVDPNVVSRAYDLGGVDPINCEGAGRVVRGGGFWNLAWDCRSACRIASGPGNRDRGLGFRLVAGQELPSGAGGSGR